MSYLTEVGSGRVPHKGIRFCDPFRAANMVHIVILIVAALQGYTSGSPQNLCANIDGFEVEHVSILHPSDAVEWTPPVLDLAAASRGYRFAWRTEASYSGASGDCDDRTSVELTRFARNVSQINATLTLTSLDQQSPAIVCHPQDPSDLDVVCTITPLLTPGTKLAVQLEVALYATAATGPAEITAVTQGWLIVGLDAHSWGGAEWIGLADANDTASQFRAVTNLHPLGFTRGVDVSRALLFVAGLGGYRASINGRALDPTSIRASVTEWYNRTYYFADDVTSDIRAVVSSNGTVVIGLEPFKHWYGLSNDFYQTAYGPRSLKSVLVVTHANGTTTWLLPTNAGSNWLHSSGSLLFEDLHAGEDADGRLATPGWESVDFVADPAKWRTAVPVNGPPGQLRPHPMPPSRVVERVIPVNVSAVPSNIGTTYRFTLPYEIAGFCTLLLPQNCARGTIAQMRHGECVDSVHNALCPVEAPSVGASNNSYTCRGDSMGMSTHEVSWRRLAVSGNASDSLNDVPELEAFTPSFQYTGFKYIEVTYRGSEEQLAVPLPNASSLSCYRIGVGFDWTGDIALGAPPTWVRKDADARVFNAPESLSSTLVDHGRLNTAPIPSPLYHCERVIENHNLSVGCASGGTIDKILFASFGTTTGGCASGFAEGNCSTTGKIGSASNSMAVVEHTCIGKEFCVVPATVTTFAPGNPCPHVVKSLAVEVHCTGDPPAASVCEHSCSDETAPSPSPPPGPAPSPQSTTTPADRFNAVTKAARSTAIANYVMDIPTDSPEGEKRGWCGDSLAAHRTLGSFFDMRAAWIKWTQDITYTSSMLLPFGTVSNIVPCIFLGAFCRNDPGSQKNPLMTDLAWGSLLPQLSAFTAALSKDDRYATWIAGAAGQYVALVHSYANNASSEFPELLNVSGGHYNAYQQGWPASSYGDWCPINRDHSVGGTGCTSVSALLNSVYLIFDTDAVVSLIRAGNTTGSNSTSPTEAQLLDWAAQARASFSAAFRRHVSFAPNVSFAPKLPISGLAFRDPVPPNVTHHGNNNIRPSVQVEAASGMAVMDDVLTGNDTERAALGDMLAGLVMNVSTDVSALQMGGVIDMAQLGRTLISYGRPDAAFALLSTNGTTSMYHMAKSTTTVWAHPDGADGSNGRCTSHNHIMQGGSVGEAIFGIGGIRPDFVRGMVPNVARTAASHLLLAPVPWLPDAPRGATVWRTFAGLTSTSWAASTDKHTDRWSVWVNVTVPVGQGLVDVHVMVPQAAQRDSVCMWECGSGELSVPAFTWEWVTFSTSGGHWKATAQVPSVAATTAPDTSSPSCVEIWRSGIATNNRVVGVSDVEWLPARPGTAMFPAVTVQSENGAYAFFASSC